MYLLKTLKTIFLHEVLLFYVRFFCSINFCFGPFEIRQFKTNCSVLINRLGISPRGAANYGMCITYVFVDSACKQLTMVSSQVPNNMLGPNKSSDDLTDGCVHNFMSLFE